jgi:hypothetical protein
MLWYVGLRRERTHTPFGISPQMRSNGADLSKQRLRFLDLFVGDGPTTEDNLGIKQ